VILRGLHRQEVHEPEPHERRGATPCARRTSVVTARNRDVRVPKQLHDVREVGARVDGSRGLGAAQNACARAHQRRFLTPAVTSDSKKTCHSSSSTAPSLAPIHSSAPRLVATLTSQPRRVAETLALTILSASSALAQVGTSYCTPAVTNSTGAPAAISGSGSAVVHLNNLVLTGSGLPQSSFGFFLTSTDRGSVFPVNNSQGRLCLGGAIGRYVGPGQIQNSGSTGSFLLAINLTSTPQPTGAVAVQPGETWNFQCWYRDAVGGSATSNFSDGLEVLFAATQTVPGMVPISAETFMMGSNAPSGPPYHGDPSTQPVHQVTISDSFWIGQHEVTQAEYQALMGANPSGYVGASRPVETVNWHQARAYCAALTAQQAGNLPGGYEYRLPTEAEWEYSCRAGTTTEFHYGQDLFCNQARFRYGYHTNPPATCGNPNGAAPVGSYVPNAWDLYDMHGNVHEWCLDSFAPYSSAAVTDPFVTGGTSRVGRGAGWTADSHHCRTANRNGLGTGYSYEDIGFRVVLAPALVP
jgi:formylglycine-generating enzyme required for sulfatase activity